MDLAKAKNVVLGMLLAFNIFLLVINVPHFSYGRVPRETIENAVTILEGRGVTLETSIPSASKKARRLVYGSEKIDRDEIINKLFGENAISSGNLREVEDINAVYEYEDMLLYFYGDGTFVFTDRSPNESIELDAEGNVRPDDAKKVAREFLKKRGLLSGRYVEDGLRMESSGGVTITYIEKHDEFLVFDNYCVVTVTPDGVERVEYSWMQVKGFAAEVPGETTYAYQVLLAHYKDGSDAVITDIDIGYKYYQDDVMDGMETIELVPVWRIKLKGGSSAEYLSLQSGGGEW